MWMSLAQNISFDYNSKEIEWLWRLVRMFDEDIDECAERTAFCPHQDSICINTRGHYKCPVVRCPDGFAKTTATGRQNRWEHVTPALFFCDCTVFIIRCWPFLWWSDFRIECFRVVTNIVEILILTRLTAFQQKLKHNMHYIFLKMLNYVFSTTEICKNI